MKEALKYIYSDLWRSVRVPTKGGLYYLLIVIDDFFKKVWVLFLNRGAICLEPSRSGR